MKSLFRAGSELAGFRLADVLQVLQAGQGEDEGSQIFRELVGATLDLPYRNGGCHLRESRGGSAGAVNRELQACARDKRSGSRPFLRRHSGQRAL